jgi:hypothetical protein
LGRGELAACRGGFGWLPVADRIGRHRRPKTGSTAASLPLFAGRDAVRAAAGGTSRVASVHGCRHASSRVDHGFALARHLATDAPILPASEEAAISQQDASNSVPTRSAAVIHDMPVKMLQPSKSSATRASVAPV